MAKMRTVAPRMKQIQDTFKDDREKLGRAMMELYKKEKINPLAGCLPMLVQIPFFISFYRVLLESVEMRQAPFLLWINDLSSRDPFFVLPLLMGGAMFAQFKLNPAPPDPMQAKIMQFMPLVMTGMMAWFPSGLVLYWLTNTVLTIAAAMARQPSGRGRGRQAAIVSSRELARIPSPPSPAPPGAARSASFEFRVRGCRKSRTASSGALPAAAPRRTVARFSMREGKSLDEGLALYFPAPASYTGEDVLELQGHGGALVLDLLLQRLLELGCRMARPGEFSERAFLNGKIDIAQAEADRGSDRCRQRRGGARRGALAARRVLRTHSRPDSADSRSCAPTSRPRSIFPTKRSIFSSSGALAADGLRRSSPDSTSITAAARQGALLREGLNVVIAGKPNAGKSSLLNRLAGDEVAIVTDLPGTTRDVLRQHVHLDGLPLESGRTPRACAPPPMSWRPRACAARRSEIARADRVLYVVDAAQRRAPAKRSWRSCSASRRGCRSRWFSTRSI